MAWPENVRKSDLEISYYRGSGPGGQHRNKNDTACRIVHKPTGLSSSAEDSKSQPQNRQNAFRKLAEKLVPMMVEALSKIPAPSRSEEVIRTYHAVRKTVTDKRVPGKKYNYDEVVSGKALDNLLDDVTKEVSSILTKEK